jgi:hypothetical protein
LTQGGKNGYRDVMHKGVKRDGGKRNTLPITLREGDKAIIDGICEQTGMAKVVLIGRLISWFARQPDLVKKIVLGIHPQGVASPLADVLEHIAREMRDLPDDPDFDWTASSRRPREPGGSSKPQAGPSREPQRVNGAESHSKAI